MRLHAEFAATLSHLVVAHDALIQVLNQWSRVDSDEHQELAKIQDEILRVIKRFASQYPIAKDIISLPGAPLIPAVKLILLIQIEKAGSVTALWNYCGVNLNNHNTHSSSAKEQCLILAAALSVESAAYHSVYVEALEKVGGDTEMAELIVARTLLSHLYEQWKEYDGMLQSKDMPKGRPYPDRSLYGWPATNLSQR